MPVAIIEISERATSRSGVKRDGTPWGPIWSQKAHVHGQSGTYPREIEFSVRDADSAKRVGFYVLDGGTISMETPPGSSFQRLTLNLREDGSLIGLGEAIGQMTEFMNRREAA